LLQAALVPQREAEFGLPANIGDYTDFYASIHHATSIGRQFRPDHPLLPNYQWIPIAYHGRSSSIQVSERDFHRPRGQYKPKGTDKPALAPTERLDFELEVGIFVGQGNPLGSPIPIGDAESHVFGLCLLNDWSARDIQAWEYQPLGPFIAKNFATTISPWVVTLEALAPFRVPLVRTSPSTPPLPYLDDWMQAATGGVDMRLEASLETARMRAAGLPPQRLALSNMHHCHWTLAQLIAHHTVGGCNLRPGDLLGTGTLSGPTAAEAGSLAELTVGGSTPVTLPDGESRAFLADGDRVLLRAWCEGAGRRRIGFGTAAATVLPARAGV
jgi:fumarylacetoacetase